MPLAVIALAGLAHAGPLDRPDPDDMGRYRCTDRPLTRDNDVPLGNRTATDAPPGHPVYPTGLGSSLVPFATDAAIKKASRKHKVVAYNTVATLATRGVPVVADCENRAIDDSHFAWGCEVQLACQLYTEHDGHGIVLDRRPQAASRFAPIEEARDAVGLLAFYEPDLFLPLTPDELAQWDADAEDYHATAPEIPWVEVQEKPEGWLVWAPRRVHCGCERDIVRRAYWVSKDGRACPLVEDPQVLAQFVGECKE
ncbi:MAG: hypothetical protein R3F59_29285 [Myxococcota bacterium]